MKHLSKLNKLNDSIQREKKDGLFFEIRIYIASNGEHERKFE